MNHTYVPPMACGEVVLAFVFLLVLTAIAVTTLIMLCFAFPDLAVILVMIPVVIALGYR